MERGERGIMRPAGGAGEAPADGSAMCLSAVTGLVAGGLGGAWGKSVGLAVYAVRLLDEDELVYSWRVGRFH